MNSTGKTFLTGMLGGCGGMGLGCVAIPIIIGVVMLAILGSAAHAISGAVAQPGSSASSQPSDSASADGSTLFTVSGADLASSAWGHLADPSGHLDSGQPHDSTSSANTEVVQQWSSSSPPSDIVAWYASSLTASVPVTCTGAGFTRTSWIQQVQWQTLQDGTSSDFPINIAVYLETPGQLPTVVGTDPTQPVVPCGDGQAQARTITTLPVPPTAGHYAVVIAAEPVSLLSGLGGS